jgi:autotransporter-associated beta strand protein
VSQAQTTYAWTQPNSGTSGNWNNHPGWATGNPVSGTSTILSFTTLGGNANAFTFTNDIGSFTANGLSFNNYGSGTFTIAAGTTVFTMGGTNPFYSMNGAGNSVFSGTGGVVLNANTTVNGGGNGYLNITSVVSGAGGIIVNQTGNGIFSLAGANTFIGGVTLTSGYLQLSNATALGTGALTVNGGAVRFGAANTIANNITANSTLVVASGAGSLSGTFTPTLTGVISGASGLTLNGYNTAAGVILQGANTYNGATVLRPFIPNSTQTGSTLTLSEANGSILSTSITLGKNTTLTIGGTTANANRIPDTAAFTIDNGIINYVPVTAGTTEVVGNVSVTGGLRLGTTAVGVSNMQFGTLTRNDNAVLWLTGTNFGTITSTTTATNITFSGGITTANNLSAGAGTQIGVLPFAVGSSATNPRSFVTYDATNGLTLVPYNNTTYVTQVTAGSLTSALADQNIHLNGAGTYNLNGSTLTVNAVTTTSSTVTITNGTLNVHSGVIVNFDSVIWNNVTLNFPNTGYIHQSWHQVVNGTSTITGSNGLVVGGYQTGGTGAFTLENSTGNPFTGGLFVNGHVNVGFRADNQLGAAAGNITLSGGGLAYNALADLTISRNIKINGTGLFTNNFVGTGGTTGNATATTVLTLSGVVSGDGAVIKEGVGILNLTGANTYGGGTVVTGGTLRYTADNNLGAAGTRIVLNGGTLQPLTAGTNARPIQINANSTILTDVATTLSGGINNIGALYGTALPTLTKSGTGTLSITVANPLWSGIAAATAGNLTFSEAGSATQLSVVAATANSVLTLDNTATFVNNRLGDQTNVSLGGGRLNYIAPSVSSGATAEQFGMLTITAAGSVVNIDAGAATTPTVLRFAGLTFTAGNVTFRGTDLGGTTGNYTRILFDVAPAANGQLITNAFFAGTSGTGTSTLPAVYDTTRGVILFTPTSASGTLLDNFAPTNLNNLAAYTTTGDATANTGVQIYSLVLDGGSTLTLNDGANAPSATNANTPTGTLRIAGGTLVAQNGAKTISAGSGTSTKVVDFGGSPGTITTTSDLTLGSTVTLSGPLGLTKLGAGTLTVSGPYTVAGPLTVSAGNMVFGQNATVQDLSGAGGVSIGTNTLTVNSVNPTTFSGSFAGTGGLIKTGTATFTFSPTNSATLSGGVVIGQGTLLLGSANAAATVFASPLTLGSTTGNTSGSLDLNGFSPPGTITGLTIVGTGTGHQIINSNTTTASTISLDLPADATIPIALGGNIVVNKNGSTTITLSGTAQPPATTTGVINVNAGTLVVASGTPVSPGMSFTAGNNATMSFGSFGNNNTDAGAFGTLTLNGGTAAVTGGAGDLAINKVVATGGTLNFTGSANFWWHFRNAGAGITTNPSSTTTTFIQGASLTSRIQNDTGSALLITVAAGTTASGIDLDNGIHMNAGGTNPGFIKQGAGVMQLSFQGTNTANFQVTAGTLQVAAGTTVSGISTVNGGVLRGAGTLSGATTVSAGGFIRGGTIAAQTGTLTVNNNLVLTNNGGLQTAVSRASANTATASLVNVTGATNVLNLNPGTGNTFSINLVNDPAAPMVNGETYTITLASVATAGNIQLNGASQTANTTIPATAYTLTSPNFTAFNSVVLSVDGSGNNLVLVFSPVPEPGSIVAVGGAVLLVGGWVRRRIQRHKEEKEPTVAA